MEKSFKWKFLYSIITVFITVFPLNLSAAPHIVDDFTGSLSLDNYTNVESSRVLDTVNQNLILSTKASAFYQSFKNTDIVLLQVDQPDLSLLQADLSLTEVSLGNPDTQQAFVRLGADFYKTSSTVNVFATISLGDRGNGLEAFYEIQEYIPGNPNPFDLVSYSQGTLNTSAINLNTPYTASISYDDDNNFIFTFNNETISASGPEKAEAIEYTYLFVGSSVRFGQDNSNNNDINDARPDDGSVAFVTSTVDNVVTSTTTSPLNYDDFSTDQIDTTKWDSDETSTEIVDDKLVMKAKSQSESSIGTNNLRSSNKELKYIGAKVTILDSSVWSPGTRLRGRIQKYLGNDTYNSLEDESYIGYIGDLYSHMALERNVDGSFSIQIYIGRATSSDFSSETDIYITNIYPDIPISYGDTIELAIEQQDDSLVNFKIDGSTFFTFDPFDTDAYPALSGNLYPPFDKNVNVQSRVQGGPGEAHIQFDDLTISDESNRNIVKRSEIAQSLLRAKYGTTYMPPAASGMLYDDVSANDFNADWIEQLGVEGITEGCAENNFCPNMVVTKEQLALLILKTKNGSSYTPSAATGSVFTDITDNADWIEELAKQGITAGCEKNKFCPYEAVTLTAFENMLVRAFPELASFTVILPDLPLTNSDVERQVFINEPDNITATFLDDGSGIVYSGGDGSGPGSKLPFNWFITNNVLTIQAVGEAAFTFTAKNIEGNKFTFYNSSTQQNEIYSRGLPLSISDLDGKIFNFDVSNDPNCLAKTIKFNTNTADFKESCDGVQEVFTNEIVVVTELDNVVGLQTETLDPVTLEPIVTSSRLILLQGSTDSIMKVAIIREKEGVLEEVEIVTWTLTDTEAF